jgi:hypothetical protein
MAAKKPVNGKPAGGKAVKKAKKTYSKPELKKHGVLSIIEGD